MDRVRSILLVDDNQTSTFLNQQLINKLGLTYQVLTACNGQQALDILKQSYLDEKEFPELILVDLKMPVLDGFEFYKAFRQLDPEKQKTTKVVVLTTSLAATDIQRAKEADLKHFINKPLTAQKLMAILPKRNIEVKPMPSEHKD
jgi:CheY-like chemotaxis protein